VTVRLRLALVAVAAGALTACGSTPQTASHSPAASLSGQPAGKGPLLIVVAEALASHESLIRLLREDGTEAGQLRVQANVQVLGASGSRIFLLSGSHLQGLHVDGSIEDLGQLPKDVAQIWPSPDGQRWVWAASAYVASATAYQSAVQLGQKGAASRTIQSRTDGATWLLPVSWTPQGVFTQHMGGIDGYFVFGLPVLSKVDRIDPDRGSLAPVKTPDGCAFADQSADGTVACMVRGNYPILRVVAPSGAQTSIPLATPRFNITGDVYFSVDGTMLAVCGAEGIGGGMGNPNPQPEAFGTDLVRVSDGSIVRIGPPGVRLAMGWRSWLPDGKLVLWRPSGAAGGPPGLFIVDPVHADKTRVQVPTSGSAAGYLAAG
jgi:hypothetical protein